MTALILDGQLKSALCAVRSLGEKKVSLCVGAQRGSAMALHSTYANTTFVYASPKTHPEQFLRDVEAAAKSCKEKPVIFAFSDATSLLLAREYERVRQWAIFVVSDRSSTEIAADKQATSELAERLGIPTIRTYTQEQFGDITFPAVVKNRHSIVWSGTTAISGSASFVCSQEALRMTFERIAKETGEAPLVMEFIKGEEYGIEMVCKEGEVLSVFAHTRIRSLSPRGGAAVVKETAPETSELRMMRSYAEALVRELSWNGPVMVEFKIDARDGKICLMEINGRFWGSLPLAVAAGVDFPYQVYTLATDTATSEMFDVRSRTSKVERVRTRHFLGDCKWLLQVLFANDPLRTYLYPKRSAALWDFILEFFRSKSDIFSWSDPMPVVYEYIDILNTWRSKA